MKLKWTVFFLIAPHQKRVCGSYAYISHMCRLGVFQQAFQYIVEDFKVCASKLAANGFGSWFWLCVGEQRSNEMLHLQPYVEELLFNFSQMYKQLLARIKHEYDMMIEKSSKEVL